ISVGFVKPLSSHVFCNAGFNVCKNVFSLIIILLYVSNPSPHHTTTNEKNKKLPPLETVIFSTGGFHFQVVDPLLSHPLYDRESFHMLARIGFLLLPIPFLPLPTIASVLLSYLVLH